MSADSNQAPYPQSMKIHMHNCICTIAYVQLHMHNCICVCTAYEGKNAALCRPRSSHHTLIKQIIEKFILRRYVMLPLLPTTAIHICSHCNILLCFALQYSMIFDNILYFQHSTEPVGMLDLHLALLVNRYFLSNKEYSCSNKASSCCVAVRQ